MNTTIKEDFEILEMKKGSETDKGLEVEIDRSSSIQYDLSAIDILKILGYTEPQTKETISIIDKFEEQYQKKVPEYLKTFILLAMDNPLLKTADIWTNKQSFWFYFYDEIAEMNEEDEDVFPEFSHTPREMWHEKVEDYLEIGSDYAAGVVRFGIRVKDMNQKNPPVYMQHEADEITQWNLLYQTLSDYLLAITCDALFGFEYRTSQGELEEKGWEYQSYTYSSSENLQEQELLLKHKIKVSKLQKIQSMYYSSSKERIACCYKEKENILFLFQITEKETEVITIQKIKK